MKIGKIGSLIAGFFLLALTGLVSATGYYHGGESGVFMDSSTTIGGFTSYGNVETVAGTSGGGEANSYGGNSSVAGGSYQGGALQGFNGSEMTGTSIFASASQTPHSSTASASTGSVAEGSVQNGSVATFTNTGAGASATSYGGHYYNWNHPM